MAVDRGGLEYSIRVVNAFSAPLRQFRSDLLTVRRSLSRFKRDVRSLGSGASGVSRALSSISTAQRRLNNSTRTAITATNKRVASLTRLQSGLRSVSVAETSAASARQSSVASSQQQSAALAAQVTTLNRQATALGRLKGAGRSAASGLSSAGSAANSSRSAFGGLLLTTKRLVTTLIFFESARAFLDGVRRMIVGTVQFSAALETAKIGIAALFTTAGQVVDINGNLLTGQRALAEAQRISADQLTKLRIAGLQTAATFDELAVAFQTGLAPGLNAGLSLDEIRQFTIQISQAASALNVKQSELAEEIRSILAGTISIKNTRIAVALGITNEDIRNAKKAGDVFGFLQKKFAGFSTAGSEALKTFNAKLSNAVDALLLVSSTGAEGFFSSLKDVLQGVRDFLTQINKETQQIELNPEAVAAFEAIFNSLQRSVDQARSLASSLSFSSAQGAVDALALAVDALVTLLLGALQGAIGAVADIAEFFEAIRTAAEAVFGTDLISPRHLQQGREFLAIFVRTFLATRGILLLLGLMASPVAIVVGLFLILASRMEILKKSTKDLAESLVRIRGISFEGFFRVLSAEAEVAVKNFILDFELSLIKFRELFTASFSEIGKEAGVRLLRSLKGSVDKITGLFKFFLEFVGVDENLALLTGRFLELNAAIPESRTVTDLTKAIVAGANAATKAVIDVTEAQKAQNEAFLQGVRAREKTRVAQGPKTGGDNTQVDDTIFDSLKTAGQEAVARIKGAFASLGLAIPQDIKQGLKDTEKALRDFGKVVARSADASHKSFSEKFIERLKDDLRNLSGPGGPFDLFFSFLEDSTRKLADLMADLIVDAFDPNNSVSAKERFLEFLREFAREAIRILTRIALTKFFNSVIPGDEGSGGGGTGKVSGGAIGEADRKARNFIFNFPVGFASGGSIGTKGIPGRSPQGSAWSTVRAMRPTGLDRRDIVPIWTQPKEWVIQKSSSEMYGGRVMAAINRGLLDPFALKALAGVRPSVIRRSSRDRAQGFASGGAIGSSRAASSAGQTPTQQGVVGAVIVSDDQAMQRLVAGGRNALLEFISDEAPTINGLLS